MVAWLQQHYEILGVAFAAVGVVLAWLQLRKKEPRTTSLAHSPVERSAIISGSHNQVHINTGVPSAAKAETAKPPRVSPNLVYVGAKRRPIYVSEWPREGICDPRSQEQRNHSFDALVLRFENRVASDRKIARALNVIAKLKFLHKNGATFREVDYGVWLNSPCNSTDIGIGDTRELVLLGVLDDQVVTFEDKRIDGTLDFSAAPFSYLESPGIEGYDRVEIVLIDQNTQASLTTKVKFWRQGSDFCTS